MVIHIQVNKIKAEVLFKDIKCVRLRVCSPDGTVKVSAPRGVSLSTVEAFVAKNGEWIGQQQDRIRSRQGIIKVPVYAERDSHPIWGKTYLVSLKHTDEKPGVELRNGWLRLNIPRDCTEGDRQRLVKNWEREMLRAAIPPLIALWEPIMGVRVDRFFIQNMKTRWGSCNLTRRSIRINLELIRKPVECLEYVVVHEMIHLLERYHNARFYELMNHFLPDWKEREARLTHTTVGRDVQ